MEDNKKKKTIDNQIITVLVGVVILVLFILLTIKVFINDKQLKDLNNKLDKIYETNNPSQGNQDLIQEEVARDYDVSKFDEIQAKDIEKLSKGETIVIYIGRETCGYCQMFVPVLRETQEEYNFKAKYIDIAKIYDFTSYSGDVIDKESEKILKNLKTTENTVGFMNDFGATPMTLFVKDNKLIGGALGYYPKDSFEQELEKVGFTKE